MLCRGATYSPHIRLYENEDPVGQNHFAELKFTCFHLSLSILILLANILSTIGADRQNLRVILTYELTSRYLHSCVEVAILLQQCRSLSHLDWSAQEFHSQFSIGLTCQFIATHCQNKILKILWTVSVCFIHFMGYVQIGDETGTTGVKLGLKDKMTLRITLL
jgi:hypothetical protein